MSSPLFHILPDGTPFLEVNTPIRGEDFSDLNLDELVSVWVEFHQVNFRNCSLRGADFTEATFEEVDFSGADLRGALFYAANIEACRLNGADLRGASVPLYALKLGALASARIDPTTKFI
ncbi:pentapeptide repeat-containing protein [Corynebacterium lowii]|uniref:Serine/threonine-protein kinase B n=1 Tax=Corynebacterium lowii TaxID=1544413 RepID=A0A0Q0YHX9_9CORY|nr:pentapeptide repeat-containing protein [Corynebacterium lowii]KQB86243.1 Serine/threonine-protein kinase B [Corynebacterium lowii]MDP9852718.1 uncharacterized protein YjbI with pentapeptide repeats [Corynebacterium lowii]